MLRAWRLGNFKSVRSATEIQFSAITLIVGSNSSGKSSLLQSILALAQTVGAQQADDPLILNGSFVRLGALADLKSHGSRERSIKFGVTVDGDGRSALQRSKPHVAPAFASLDFQISSDPETHRSRLEQVSVELPESQVKLLGAQRGRSGGPIEPQQVATSLVRCGRP